MTKFKLCNDVLGWITFAIASAVYLMTMEPTASFWDCGEFISSAYKLEVGHPPGAPFFMLVANLFTQFASSPQHIALMVNAMSALFSGLTILFLFWSITHLARKIIGEEGKELTTAQLITVLGSGLVGALAYTFSDTFWFSAVEGEVYAFSSLFTAVVFWLILKWEDVADDPRADRWIILIAYLMGLSIGVHLLNLLCIPACVLVYYFKKTSHPTLKGIVLSLILSAAIIVMMMYGVVQGLVEVCGWFELLFVNVLGMPYNSGVYAYVLLLIGTIVWSICETMRDEVRELPMKISFILSVILIGIPFMGSGYLLGVLIILALIAFVFFFRKLDIKMMNTILLSLLVIVVGYSSYAVTLIRATADTPMNQNAPDNIFTLRTYLAREQYGRTPLLYGQTYVSEVERTTDGQNCVPVTEPGANTWSRVIKKDKSEKDKYYVSRVEEEYQYVDKLNMLFPRMHSTQGSHVEAYKQWADVKGTPVKYDRCGETVSVVKPTFAENLRFFFRYQLNFMYWRYFMWNFSGRQNDIQGNGELMNGNWITGISAIDEILVGPQEDMPSSITNNKGHNAYYMLPLLLGIIGIFFQTYAGKKGVQSFWITGMLFFMTGIAIVLYLNQTPFQPRERDYAYAGSFYAFCIWIGFGVAGIAKILEQRAKVPATVAAAIAVLATLFVPIQMAAQNWDDHDRSDRYIARDFGSNYLESCEPNAIIFTNGDNDTFPLWYAQEVEGIRTDVRVCNTSYLQTDWYINQMKKQAYDSEALPISWEYADYVQGTRDAAYVVPLTEESVPLKTALDFVRSNDPKFKKIPGYSQSLDYIPAETLTLEVDSATAVSNGVVRADEARYMPQAMKIDLKGKSALGKQELIILDMLLTNNWERPIYYAITVAQDQWCNLDPYFQQTGLANQIVPMEVKNTIKSVNAEKMYDNVMNKFKWGGVNKPGIYLDENALRMCKTYRMAVFSKLTATLLSLGEEEKARKVLDKCMEVLPAENIPLDYSGLSLGEFYYALDEKEKAVEIMTAIIEDALRNVNWIFRLEPHQLSASMSELQHNLAVAQEVLRVSAEHNPEFNKAYQEEFDNYHMAFNGSNK